PSLPSVWHPADECVRPELPLPGILPGPPRQTWKDESGRDRGPGDVGSITGSPSCRERCTTPAGRLVSGARPHPDLDLGIGLCISVGTRGWGTLAEPRRLRPTCLSLLYEWRVVLAIRPKTHFRWPDRPRLATLVPDGVAPPGPGSGRGPPPGSGPGRPVWPGGW